MGKRAFADDRDGQALRRVVGGKAQPLTQLAKRRVERAGRGDPSVDARAFRDEFLDCHLVRHVAAGAEHGGERLAKRAAARRTSKRAPSRRLGKIGRLALVEHLEMPGDIGLERELLQQALAEGMDGLDLQPARRLQGAGEEPPRQRQFVLARPAAFDRFDLAGELLVGQHRPRAEALEDSRSPSPPPRPW